MGRGRVTKLEFEERIADTEQYMLRLRSNTRVKTFLANKWGVSPSTVSHWITEVQRRRRAAADATNRPEKRDDVEAILNEVIFLCFNRTKTITVYEEIDVIDGQGNITGTRTVPKTVTKPDPDNQRILHAVAQLRALGGLDMPLKLSLSGTVGTTGTTTHTTTATDRDAIVAALQGLTRPGP